MKDTLWSLLRRDGADRRISLHISLGILVAGCVVPAIIISTLLLTDNLDLKRDLVYHRTELLTGEVMGDLDRELAGIESGLRVLATSQSLAKGDLNSFHQEARNALRLQVVYNYILTDRHGKQVLNTLKPLGESLPTSGTPVALNAVFEQRKSVLTDMFLGPVTQRPAIAMGVPVFGDNHEVLYSLNIGLDPAYLSNLLKRHELPNEWLVAVIDNSGTIVARSRDAETYVGQKAVAELLEATKQRKSGNIETKSKDGIDVVTAFDHSKVWGWTVVVGAPRAHLNADLTRTTTITVLLIGLGIGMGSLLAYILARQVLTSVKYLNDAAIALRNGQRVELPVVQLKEAQAVGVAIVEASLRMEDVHHRATHDNLTKLGNRDLFNAVGAHQVAEAKRASRPLAIMLIDLDNFKQVNDTEGHAKGDAVLIEVSFRINAIIRASDLAARFGGDEFCVLLVDADQATATAIAERLVAEISRTYSDVRTPVGASIGIAIYPDTADSLDMLLKAADGALYRVKESGKNGLAVSAPGVSVLPDPKNS